MAIAPSDQLRAAQAPVTAARALRTLDLTTSNATIILAAGAWEVFNGGTVHAVASLTGTTASMPPSTGAAEVTAFMIPAGGAVSFTIDEATTLNARALSSTSTLYLHRKAVA